MESLGDVFERTQNDLKNSDQEGKLSYDLSTSAIQVWLTL